MAEEVQQGQVRMETDLEAAALSDSKHSGSFHGSKSDALPPKKLEGRVQDKHKGNADVTINLFF